MVTDPELVSEHRSRYTVFWRHHCSCRTQRSPAFVLPESESTETHHFGDAKCGGAQHGDRSGACVGAQVSVHRNLATLLLTPKTKELGMVSESEPAGTNYNLAPTNAKESGMPTESEPAGTNGPVYHTLVTLRFSPEV